MRKKILAVCDTEENYVRRFCEYVNKKEGYPFEGAGFTSGESLRTFCEEYEVDTLLVAEHVYDASLEKIVKDNIIILSEEEKKEEGVQIIYKYQSCENVLREVMRYCAEHNPQPADKKIRKSRMKMIGFYTPIHRCMQTSFAITLGQILAKNHKVLYLNFESFSGFERRMGKEFMSDLTDLIYYVTNAREALFYKLKSITETIRNLDYIPPAFSCMDLSRVTPEQWNMMFTELEMHTSYEYFILDLSENMQGIFDILRRCEKVFTLIRDDSAAEAKLFQYEKLLECADYKDVLEKTKRCKLPFIRQISFDMEQFTYGELADYVRNLVKEEFYES